MDGWIKLHRKSLDHWLYQENRPHTKREAWEDILLLCNHSDEKVLIGNQLIDCKRGQSVMSLKSWSNKFKWSIQQVRTFFNMLEKDSMINIEGLKYSTRITVCNYVLYQDKQQTDNKLITNSQQTDNILLTTNKKDKNEKNDKNKEKKSIKKENEFSFVEEEFTDAFSEWIEYKKARKENYKTEKSLIAAYNKLKNLSGNDPVIAKEIVEQSLANNWAGLFELQNNYGKNKQSNEKFDDSRFRFVAKAK